MRSVSDKNDFPAVRVESCAREYLKARIRAEREWSAGTTYYCRIRLLPVRPEPSKVQARRVISTALHILCCGRRLWAENRCRKGH